MPKYEQGICPYCKSDDIEYFIGELQDDGFFDYDCQCNKCRKHFVESYQLVFNDMFDEDGREIC